MKLDYDSKIDAFYIRFNNQRYHESDEIQDGVVFDYDKKGKIIGIEVLEASKKFPKDFKSHLKQNQKNVAVSFV